jgi:hypothetical protein
MRRAALTLLAVTLLVLACGEEESPSGGGGGGGGTAPDTILMEPSAQPTYGWQKGNADTIEVARTSNLATPVWRTVASDLDGIGSGLTHGTSGAGRTVPINTESVLTIGVEYRVRIVRQTGSLAVTKTFVVEP